MPFSDFEARLRRAEDGVRVLGMLEIPNLRARIAKYREQVLTTGSGWAGPNCATQITGKIVGCDLSTPLANSTLHLVGSGTGHDYGTWSLPLGTFDVTIRMVNDPSAGSQDVPDAYVSGPTPRFQTGRLIPTGVFTSTIVPCTLNSGYSLADIAASGYHCTTWCQFPLADSLDVNDSVYGVGTATFTTGRWRNTMGGRTVDLQANPEQVTTGSGTNIITGSSSKTCPNAGGTKLSITFTIPAGATFYPAGGTITFSEP